MATWKLNGSTFWIWQEQDNPKQNWYIHCRQQNKIDTDNRRIASWSQIDFPELQTLSTQRHCPSVICYTSAPLILLHLIEHLKKPDNPPLSLDWVFWARYWQRSMKECRQFCHFFKHQTALFHIWRMPLFSPFLKALDKTNTLRPFDRWEIESEPRASLEPTFPISGWS